MDAVKVSIDNVAYQSKPQKRDIYRINNSICNSYNEIEINKLAYYVGEKGHTFAPAIFNGSRRADSVIEIQLLCLDFDNKDKVLTIGEALERSDKLDLPIAFMYETFSSQNGSKFRIVFRYFEPIVDQEFYKVIMNVLFELFPEADKAAKDWSRMFYSGKGLLTDVSNDVIYPENLFSALHYSYGGNNKEKVRKIKKFAEENSIALINNMFYTEYLDIDAVKSLDTPILLNISEEKAFSENIFVIHKYENTAPSNIRKRFSDTMIKHITHDALYNNCMLIQEFKDGTRKLHYHELWGILTNIVHIAGGIKYFRNILNSLENVVDYKFDKWYSNCTQISKCPYGPKKCSEYCPYCDECLHSKNIITTVNTRKNEISIIDNTVKYISIDEARAELYKSIQNAMVSDDDYIHIIKAQTGIGKTHSYIKCIKELA